MTFVDELRVGIGDRIQGNGSYFLSNVDFDSYFIYFYNFKCWISQMSFHESRKIDTAITLFKAPQFLNIPHKIYVLLIRFPVNII